MTTTRSDDERIRSNADVGGFDASLRVVQARFHFFDGFIYKRAGRGPLRGLELSDRAPERGYFTASSQERNAYRIERARVGRVFQRSLKPAAQLLDFFR